MNPVVTRAGIVVLLSIAASASALDPDGFDWASIPLDTDRASTLGSLDTRRAFSRSLRDTKALAHCVEGWDRPPGIPEVQMDQELRLASGEDSVTIVDVVILESNPADARLNRCVVERLRGTRHPAPGVTPGRRFRIRWESAKRLG